MCVFFCFRFCCDIVSHSSGVTLWMFHIRADPFGAANKMVFIPLQIVYYQLLASQHTRFISTHTHIHSAKYTSTCNQNNDRNKAVVLACTGCSNWEPMSPGAKQIQSKFILKVNNLWRHKTFTFNLQMGCITLHLFAIVSRTLSLSLPLGLYYGFETSRYNVFVCLHAYINISICLGDETHKSNTTNVFV